MHVVWIICFCILGGVDGSSKEPQAPVHKGYDSETNTLVERYTPAMTLGRRPDGSSRVWSRKVAPEPISEVILVVQKLSGAEDCHLVLRVGVKGSPLERGKRIFLKHTRQMEVGWYVNGLRTGDDPLIVEVVNGQVALEHVKVHRKR
ncbi:MAG: hypothetical protein VCG02_09645 [Verrucomicrobiota bacterium]